MQRPDCNLHNWHRTPEVVPAPARGRGSTFIRGLLIMALLVPGPAATAHDSVARPAADALNAVIRVWNDQIEELTAVARQLAAAGDTYEFVARPNIPYVDAHYGLEQLAADRIDTVLIVNRAGKPVFWRRLNHGPSRGFADAKAFLAELPRLPAPGAAGVASFAGVATLAQGTSLVVAMPIQATAGTGGARGWLIAARPFEATPLSRLEEAAHIPVQLLDPGASAADGDIELALREPLTPIGRTGHPT